jgi:hypothetical protein
MILTKAKPQRDTETIQFMEFHEVTHNNFRYWHLPHLTASGVFHGFGGASLDVRYEKDAWRESFPAGPNLHLLKQVHGAEIALAGASDSDSEFEADAWILTKVVPNSVFGVRTADCVPVLLFSSKINAALHCGWRGVLGNLLPKMLAEFSRHDVKMSDIKLAIGPHARGCCYEIAADLEHKIIERMLVSREKVVRDESGTQKMYCELSVLLLAQAQNAGIAAENCFEHTSCTICSDEFFSHRRQKDLAGRQVSFVSLAKVPAKV